MQTQLFYPTDDSMKPLTAHFWTRLLVILCAAVLLLPVYAASAGVVVTSLHSFAVATNGINPWAGLILGSDGYLYGATGGGGTKGDNGTIFKIGANGVLTTLYSFTGGSNGAGPSALVQASDGYLYGTAGSGTVFKISTNGAFTTLYTFRDGIDASSPNGLIQGNDGYSYGTTDGAGTNKGTIFRMSPDGVLTTLYSFTGGTDGAYPKAGLVQRRDGSFYGTTWYGGAYVDQYGYGEGAVFQITSNGVFTSLYSFSDTGDGRNPNGLIEGSDGNLYGTTFGGGASHGTVFQITTNGVLTTLYSFTGADGDHPFAALAQGNDGDFYGTTYEGGAQNGGTVFRFSLTGSLTTLYSFPYDANSILVTPRSVVQDNNGNLYGTTSQGGSQQFGSLFQINAVGTFTNLFSFTRATDGAIPQGALVQGKDDNFYGTCSRGGSKNLGTLFRMSASGACTALYSFDRTGGANPAAGLALGTDGNLYGTAAFGGAYDSGTVFKASTNGGFSRLYSFTGGTDGESPSTALVQGRDGRLYGTTPNNYDNVFRIGTSGGLTTVTNFRDHNQNANPQALVQGSDGNFYGTLADYFPSTQPPFYQQVFYSYGTVFKMSPAGAVSTLHLFDGITDGANPLAGLIQGRDGNLYGTTSGGTDGSGSVFRISTNGDFTTLYFFSGGADGATPMASLVQGTDGNFYGTTVGGGSHTNQYGQTFGTVFQISTNGEFTTLYSFTGGNDGGNPQASLVEGSDGNFYGTTAYGGQGGAGTAFRLSIGPIAPPRLNLTSSASSVVLSWSADKAGFTLQSTTNLGLSSVWRTNSPPPVIVNGFYTVTNPIAASQQFYRLIQ
jgi:uncharacterized repeat protein (TIGR03803 family)